MCQWEICRQVQSHKANTVQWRNITVNIIRSQLRWFREFTFLSIFIDRYWLQNCDAIELNLRCNNKRKRERGRDKVYWRIRWIDNLFWRLCPLPCVLLLLLMLVVFRETTWNSSRQQQSAARRPIVVVYLPRFVPFVFSWRALHHSMRFGCSGELKWVIASHTLLNAIYFANCTHIFMRIVLPLCLSLAIFSSSASPSPVNRWSAEPYLLSYTCPM